MGLKSKNMNSLIVQGSILAAASMIVRLIGFFYRIPLINLIEDEGNGYYSISFEIYSFLLIISSYGLPAAISKITSARIAEGKYKEADCLFKAAIKMGLVIGIGTSLVLWFGSMPIAHAVGIDKAYLSIRALAPAILIFSVMAVLRGYFQGSKNMIPTAASQVVEQVFNAVFSIVMAMLLVDKGLEYGAMGGTSGTGIGAFFGLLTLVIIFFRTRPAMKSRISSDTNSLEKMSAVESWKIILMTAFPMVIGAATYQLANFTDMVMFQQAMLHHGYAQAAVAETYGILAGKYRIFIMLPISVASAMVAAALPSLTTSHVKNNYEELLHKSSLAIRTTMILVIPAAVGLFVLALPILTLVFNVENLELAASLMRLGSITVVLYSFSTICIGLLQGFNKLFVPVKNAAIALVFKVIGNIILLFVLDTNVYGAVITNILFALIASFLNFRAVATHTGLKLNWKKTFIRPGVAAMVMGAFGFGSYFVLSSVAGMDHGATLVALGLSILIYGIAAIKTKALTENELAAFPKGHALIRFFKRVKLL